MLPIIPKSGILKNQITDLYNHCRKLDLDIIGLMCIPPFNEDSEKYFFEMNRLNQDFKLSELSMGMSSDYLIAVENGATFLRIGSSIFGERS